MADAPGALRITAKPLDPTIPPGVQLQLMLQLECVGPFADTPLLDVSLTYVSLDGSYLIIAGFKAGRCC